MDKKLKQQIISIIDDVNDMTIATVRPDGFPQARTVSYVNDGLSIYFMTPEDGQKTSNINHDNRVSLTINKEYDDWTDIESLSMGAVANRVVNAAEKEKIGNLLLKKFPEVAKLDPNIDMELAYFRIAPKVISILDYKINFGYTKLITL